MSRRLKANGVHLGGKHWCQLYPTNTGLLAQRHPREVGPVHIFLIVSL